MNDFFRDLYRYNSQCNHKLATLIALHPDQASQRALDLFSHVLNAHHIWNSRVLQQKSRYDRLQSHLPQDLEAIDLDNHAVTDGIIDAGILSGVRTYVNFKGEQGTNTVQDILFHVINHSTYHRGQIASDLKQSGIEPPVTDFIFYKR